MDQKRGRLVAFLILFLVATFWSSSAVEELLRINEEKKVTAWVDLGDYDDSYGNCDNDNVGSIISSSALIRTSFRSMCIAPSKSLL